MRKLSMSLAAVLMVAGALVLARGADAACGKVTIAEMTWASAGVAAHVEDIILKEGYGCDTEVVPGDTVPTVTSMTEKGEPDIAPEVWINSAREVVEAAVAEGRLTIAGDIFSDGGEEGWWVPTFVVEQNPELTTLQEVIKRPDLFPDKEEPGKGRFYGCPPGWACEIVNRNLYMAYGLDEAGFTLFNPGSGEGLAGAIASAYERGNPIFAYYWAPTALLGNYPMVKARRDGARPRDVAVHRRQGLRRPAAQHVREVGGGHGGDLEFRRERTRGLRVRLQRLVVELLPEQPARMEGREPGDHAGGG